MSLVSSLNQDGKYSIMETDIESNKYLLKKYFEDIYNGKTISLHPILQQYMDKNDFSISLDAFINIPQVANLQLDSQCILDLIKANDHIVFNEKDTKILPMYSSRSCLIVRDMPSHTTFQDMLNIFEGVEPKPLYIEGVGNECWYIYFEKRSSANQCYLVLLSKDPTISNKMRPKYKDAILPGNLTYAKAKYSEQFQIVESEQKEQERPSSMSQSGLPNTSSSEPITLVVPAKENYNANHATPAYNNSGHQGFSNMNKAHSIDVLNTVTPPAIIKDSIPPQLSNYGLIVSNKQHYDGQQKTLDYIKASSNNMLYPTPPLQQNQAGAGNKYTTNTHYFNNKQPFVPNYNHKNAPLAYKQQHLHHSSLHNHNNTGMITNKNNLNRNSSERNLTNGSGSVLNSFVLSHNISPSYANNFSNSNPKQQHGFESANIHSVNSNKLSQTAFVANAQGYIPPPPPAMLPPPLIGSSVFKTTSAATQNNCVNENAGLIFPPLPPPPPFMGSTPSTLASTLPYYINNNPSNVVPTNNQFGGPAGNVFWCMPPLPPSLLPLPPHHHHHHLPFPPLPHQQQMHTPPMLALPYQQRSQSSQNNLISTKPLMNNGNSNAAGNTHNNAFYMTPRGVDGTMFAGMNKMLQIPPGQVPFFLHHAAAANSFLLPPPYPHHSQINHNANNIHKFKLAATPEPVTQSNKLPYYPLNNNNKINTANPISISPKNYSPPSQVKDAFIVTKLTLAACGVGPLSTIPPQSTALRSQVTSINMYNSIATPFYYYPPPPVSQSGGAHLQFPQMLHPTPTPLLIQPTPPTELMNDSSNAFRPTYNQYAPRNPVNNNTNSFATKKEAKSHQTNHRVNLSSHDSGINNYSNNGGGKANFQTGKPLPLLPPPLSGATVYPKDIAPINKSYEYKYKGKHNNNMNNTDFNPSLTVSHTLYNSNNYTAKNHNNTTGYNRNKRDFQTVITTTPTCFSNLEKYNQTSNIYPHKTTNKHQAVIANSKFNHHTNSLSNDNTNSLASFNNSERKFQHKSQTDNFSSNLNISLYADSRFSQAENTFKPNKEILPKNASEAKASIDLANMERLSISERNDEQESAICSIATSPTPTNISLDAVLNDAEESLMNGGKISYAQIVNRKMIANNTKISSNHQISPKSMKTATSVNTSVSHVVDRQAIASNTKTCNNDVLAKIDENIVHPTLIENGNAKNLKSSPNEWTTATGPNNSRRHRGPLKNRSTDLSKNIGEESAKAIVSPLASKINVHNNIESHHATSSIKMTNNTSPGNKTTTQGKTICSTTLASSSLPPIPTASIANTNSARVTKSHQSNIKISQNTNKTTTVNSNTTQRVNVRSAVAAPSQPRKNRSYKFKLSELPFHPLNVRARELEKQRLEQQQKGRESQQDSKTVNYDKDRNDIDFPPITHKNSTGIPNKLSSEGNQSDTKRNHILTDKFESSKLITITSAKDSKKESIITVNNNASLDSKSVASSNDESSASFKSSSSTFLSSSLDPSSPPQLKKKNVENKTSTTSYLATTQHPPSVRSNSFNRERSVNNEDKNYLKIVNVDNSASNSSLDKKEIMDTKKHTTERLLNGYVV